MFLVLSGLSFAAFAWSVVYGSFTGLSFFGDKGELALLVLTTLFFIVAILKAEASRAPRETKSQTR